MPPENWDRERAKIDKRAKQQMKDIEAAKKHDVARGDTDALRRVEAELQQMIKTGQNSGMESES